MADPTRRAALLALAVRCEGASGESHELDLEICNLVWGPPGEGLRYAYPRHWTRSLDAALSLVPEGLCVDMRRCDGGSEGYAWVRESDATPDEPGDDELYVETHAKTLSLACCAAALRARAAMEE